MRASAALTSVSGAGADLAGFGQRRHAHLLTGLQPGVRLDPPAIDAQLALAAHLFDACLRQLRKLAAHPAVKPLVAVFGSDRDRLYPAHAYTPRAAARPAKIATSDRTTEALT